MIDSHCHLGIGQEWKNTSDTIMNILNRAHQSGVTDILTVACHYDDLTDMQDMATVPHVYTSFGLHPENAILFDKNHVCDILEENTELIAYGEIGLDYFYGADTRKEQINAFEKQIEIASEFHLPIIVHTRDADDDTIQILQSAYQGGLLKHGGVLHCFTGTEMLAEKATELDFYISASGILTFKKADDLRNIFQKIPLNRLLVETDAPYLAPLPYRGKRNEPAYVIEVAKCLATLKNVSLKEIGQITTHNFNQIFNIKGE